MRDPEVSRFQQQTQSSCNKQERSDAGEPRCNPQYSCKAAWTGICQVFHQLSVSISKAAPNCAMWTSCVPQSTYLQVLPWQKRYVVPFTKATSFAGSELMAQLRCRCHLEPWATCHPCVTMDNQNLTELSWTVCHHQHVLKTYLNETSHVLCPTVLCAWRAKSALYPTDPSRALSADH